MDATEPNREPFFQTGILPAKDGSLTETNGTFRQAAGNPVMQIFVSGTWKTSKAAEYREQGWSLGQFLARAGVDLACGPGFMGLVPRAKTITIEYTSADGTDVREQYSGYVARMLQHEIDHLNGVEFVDRMMSMESLTTVTNYLKFHR